MIQRPGTSSVDTLTEKTIEPKPNPFVPVYCQKKWDAIICSATEKTREQLNVEYSSMFNALRVRSKW